MLKRENYSEENLRKNKMELKIKINFYELKN